MSFQFKGTAYVDMLIMNATECYTLEHVGGIAYVEMSILKNKFIKVI